MCSISDCPKLRVSAVELATGESRIDDRPLVVHRMSLQQLQQVPELLDDDVVGIV